jgi:hypothetical protein
MSDISFLPYLRRGLATALTNRDPLRGTLPRDASLTAWIDVGGRHVTQPVVLRGPGDVTGLAPGQVLRREPAPDSTAVEDTYFALAEFRAPELPWLFIPAAPAAGNERLRPWLALVVVPEEDATLRPGSGGSLPVLSITEPSGQLPDLTDSWAWAHVQSTAPADQFAGAVEAGDPSVFARLLCPRRLGPATGYLACLVPAFEEGRLRGLGLPVPDGATVEPAWTTASLREPIDLPVYDWWRFSTGPGGDFESLCRRLQPDAGGSQLGLHALDVTAPGIVPAADHPVVVDMRGLLHTAEATPRPWREGDRRLFQDALRPLLDAGIQRAAVDPLVTDPVVAPPTYGAWPAGSTALPQHGWQPELNLDPAIRAAAGLGARIVQAHQEELVAAAWLQAGELRATVDLVNRGRLAVEVTRSLAVRAAALPEADVLRLTGRLHPLLPGGTSSITAQVASSAVPNGLLSQAMLRVTRPGTPVARDYAERTGRTTARLGAEHVSTMLAATAPGAGGQLGRALTFAVHGLPSGAQVMDPTLEADAVLDLARVPDDAAFTQAQRSLARRYRRDRHLTRPASFLVSGDVGAAVNVPPVRPVMQTSDVSDLAASVRSRLSGGSLVAAARASVVARVAALGPLIPAWSLPTSVPIGPVFPDPLCPDLVALGAQWLVPGVERLGSNRIRLVEVDATVVGAVLVGANLEMARELLWRGYPVDVRATFFRRFWEYVDQERDDIADIATAWARSSSVADNVAIGASPLTAFVVRSDLVRRYPAAHWFLQQAAPDADGQLGPVDGTVLEIAFFANLDARTAVLGFDIAPETARGDDGGHGYFVGVEEQPAGPRFGLDLAKPADFTGTPRSWDAASWGHLVSSQAELDALTHARSDKVRLSGVTLGTPGVTWGRNSAHQARATWQRPFRMLIHASRLI